MTTQRQTNGGIHLRGAQGKSFSKGFSDTQVPCPVTQEINSVRPTKDPENVFFVWFMEKYTKAEMRNQTPPILKGRIHDGNVTRFSCF
jgi:hypothetical protein